MDSCLAQREVEEDELKKRRFILVECDMEKRGILDA
jgi:hypothetical protein